MSVTGLTLGRVVGWILALGISPMGLVVDLFVAGAGTDTCTSTRQNRSCGLLLNPERDCNPLEVEQRPLQGR